ncbi:DUF3135 domain-containing protein [uncultured Amphritea sp.]|uniref:DUF3135 domain-containing protein n=1 Tax=Amphritea sp. TaxID=1872502 RepID=UPI0025E050BF|nr:DUF3135 domain-containing protein [uncultured Amphritea sp.]
MNSQNKPLDFDHLAKLAQTKPQVLERYLRLKINQIINTARPENRIHLRRLQFRIDAVRYRAKTPLAACIKISQMMHDELWCLKEVLNGSKDSKNPAGSANASVITDNRTRSADKVIPLSRAAKFKA